MRIKKIFKGMVFGQRVSVETLVVRNSDFAAPHDYGILPQAWRRGAKLIERYGVDEALLLLDRRAEQAVDRKDIQTARRWREVMAAIHAIALEERTTDQSQN